MILISKVDVRKDLDLDFLGVVWFLILQVRARKLKNSPRSKNKKSKIAIIKIIIFKKWALSVKSGRLDLEIVIKKSLITEFSTIFYVTKKQIQKFNEPCMTI